MLIDILLLAAVALWILYRYKSMLGTPPDDQDQSRARQRVHSKTEASTRREDNVIPLNAPHSLVQNDGAPASLAATLVQIKMADPAFDTDAFLDGAKKAFGIIVAAYAHGDKEVLKNLLDPPVYKSFAAAIDERVKNQYTLDFSLERIKQASIVDASLKDKHATVTVQFQSEQINATRDKDGLLIDGSSDVLATVTDIWTFGRDTTVTDPTWYLQRTTTA